MTIKQEKYCDICKEVTLHYGNICLMGHCYLG